MTERAAVGEGRVRWAAGFRGWPVTAALAVTLALAFAGLHTVFQEWGWWWWSVTLVVTSIGVGVLARAAGLGRVLAPAASLLAVAVLIVVRFSSETALLGFIPTAESFDVFRRLIRDSTYSIAWQTVPARADEAILFVLSLGAALLVVLAEVVVFSLRAPAAVGVVLAAVFLAPTVPPEGDWSRPLFAATALAYLALLLVRSPQPGTRMATSRRKPSARWAPTRTLASVSAVAVAAIVAGLVVPAALPSTDVAITTSELGPTVATGANPILRLGDDLRRNEALPVLTYSTVTGDPYYLRLNEISDFTGESWQPERPDLPAERRPAELPRASGLDADVTVSREVGYIHVGNLQSPWLPVPYPATRVTGLDGDWKWVPESLAIASNGSLAAGESFEVYSLRLDPSPEQLRAAGSRVPEGLEKYLALPELPQSIVDYARDITSHADTSYERALALQETLRDFRYSEQAPVNDGYDATNVEAIAAFLESKSGYCIHFASTMATMARVLGIPSRIIVGFQPGQREHGSDNGRTLYSVTTHDLHAWPELYFDGIGWIAFEPTPSRGALPNYANPVLAGVPTVEPGVVNPPSGPVDGPDPFAPQIDEGPTVALWLMSVDVTGWLAIGAIALLAALLAFAPAGIRSLVRHRRIAAVRAGRAPARTAWREVLDTATDAGVEVARGATPRAVVARLSRARGMTDAARAALERLCAALELAEFGPPGAVVSATSAANDAELVTACLLAGLEADRRARARLLAPSLVSGAADWLRRR